MPMLMRDLNRLKKADAELNAIDGYKGDNIDNLVVLIRLVQNNPAEPQEVRMEIEPDGPEEAAILAILDGGLAKKKAKLEKAFTDAGVERSHTGLKPKGPAA